MSQMLIQLFGTLRPDRSQHEDHFENELKCMN
jgi:hypothetical protein